MAKRDVKADNSAASVLADSLIAGGETAARALQSIAPTLTPAKRRLACQTAARVMILDRGPADVIYALTDPALVGETRYVWEREQSLNEAIRMIADPVTPTVGDILVESWGYDQTNIDYYQVVEVSPSGQSVRIREIQSTIVANRGEPQEQVSPVVGRFVAVYNGANPQGRDLNRTEQGALYRVKSDGASYRVRISSYSHARLCKATDTHYQTGGAYGH